MLSFIFSNQTHSQFFFLTLDCTPIIELSIVIEPYQSHSGITLLMTSSGNNVSIKLININIQVINLDFLFQYFDFFKKKDAFFHPLSKLELSTQISNRHISFHSLFYRNSCTSRQPTNRPYNSHRRYSSRHLTHSPSAQSRRHATPNIILIRNHHSPTLHPCIDQPNHADPTPPRSSWMSQRVQNPQTQITRMSRRLCWWWLRPPSLLHVLPCASSTSHFRSL